MGAMDTRFVKDGDKIAFMHRPVTFETTVEGPDPQNGPEYVNLRTLESYISDNSLEIQKYSLTADDIAAKSITLDREQAALFIRISGAPTISSEDFNIDEQVISWANSWLDGVLREDDQIEVVYAPVGDFGGRLVDAEIDERELFLYLSGDEEISAGLVGLDEAGVREQVNLAFNGQMLINGKGQLGNATNWPGLAWEPGVGPQGGHAFYRKSKGYNPVCSQVIGVDASKTFEFSFWARHQGEFVPRHYGFIMPVDVDGHAISAFLHMALAHTELAQDLKPGDETIHLVDATGWHNESIEYRRTIRFCNYKNSYDFSYGAESYSRWYARNAWDAGAINYDANTITLKAPWSYKNPKHADGIWPAGHPVSNANSGGTWKYRGMANTPTNLDWTKYSGTIGGIDAPGKDDDSKFPPGTVGVRIGFLLNCRGSAAAEMYLANIDFRCVS